MCVFDLHPPLFFPRQSPTFAIMITTGDIIQLLPDHVANQIAAGEVVQRPASVVKELMENAVDAGADTIDLFVKDAGRTLIQVVDNGMGMSITDFRMAFERHATSKIRTTDDIFHIQTKGFRGEALASIAAVAQIDGLSKKEGEDVGVRLIIEGGKVRDQLPATVSFGTSISVKNLFFNVPARRNFLKSNQVELRHIQEEFLRVALAHEKINFRFFHNDSEVYVLKSGNLKQRIVQIFGRKIESQLVPISEETELVKIHGFVGKPESAKKQRGEQYFFVNQRFIKSPYLHKALTEAFENLLPNQFVPTYFLYLQIDPSKIDINIHPTKTEIKFEDDYAIFAVLRSAVRHALGQFSIAPSLDFEQNPDWAFLPSKPQKEPLKTPTILVDKSYNPFEPQHGSKDNKHLTDLYKTVSEFEYENNHPQSLLSKDEFALSDLTVIQWNSRYLVVQFKGELLIVNRNRAHQLVLYEALKNSGDSSTLSQRLLFPVEMPVSEDECSLLKVYELDLVKFGFDVAFEKEKVLVSAIPTEVTTEQVPAIFSDFLNQLEQHEQILFETEIAKIIAKNMAVKKGEILALEQAKHLAQQLFQLVEPNFSPFGKRVFISLSDDEINSKFN